MTSLFQGRVRPIPPARWVRSRLLASPLDVALTVCVLVAGLVAVPPLLDWLVFSATVVADPALDRPADACRGTNGACWVFVGEWWRFLLFGRYPLAEQWRPMLVVAGCLTLIALSCRRGAWRPWLAVVWAFGLSAGIILMAGGVFGLTPVPSRDWGGLPLTLGLSLIGLAVGLPLGILLALGRHFGRPPVSSVCAGAIETVRGIPLIALLFFAGLVVPFLLPPDLTPSLVVRAQIAVIVFAAAYASEVVRGGLQAIPAGQIDAARALGCTWSQAIARVVLPQALRLSLPPMVNTGVGIIKDTALVGAIGLADVVESARAALTNPDWLGFYREAYVFVGLVYFALCFTLARYARRLERRDQRPG